MRLETGGNKSNKGTSSSKGTQRQLTPTRVLFSDNRVGSVDGYGINVGRPDAPMVEKSSLRPPGWCQTSGNQEETMIETTPRQRRLELTPFLRGPTDKKINIYLKGPEVN